MLERSHVSVPMGNLVEDVSRRRDPGLPPSAADGENPGAQRSLS